MKITRSHLKRLIKEVMLSEPVSPPWLEDGYSRFQSDMNDFLDESSWEPGVLYYWNDEDIIVILPDDDGRSEQERAHELLSIINFGSSEKRWNAPDMNPAVVELENGSWAIKLNAQMTQDEI